jgi:hypothetical protein
MIGPRLIALDKIRKNIVVGLTPPFQTCMVFKFSFTWKSMKTSEIISLKVEIHIFCVAAPVSIAIFILPLRHQILSGKGSGKNLISISHQTHSDTTFPSARKGALVKKQGNPPPSIQRNHLRAYIIIVICPVLIDDFQLHFHSTFRYIRLIRRDGSDRWD